MWLRLNQRQIGQIWNRLNKLLSTRAVRGLGGTVGAWKGCASGIDGRIFAQAQRYKKIAAEWDDENGKHHSTELGGFVAHVFQHETDHLNGVLFFEWVTDPTTYMTANEYRKRSVAKK